MSETKVQTRKPAERRLRVVGVGDAGCKALDVLIERWRDRPETIAVNTDAGGLKDSQADRKVQLGEAVTRGLGAGGIPRIGHRAVDVDRDRVKALVKDTDILFFIAGLGGGTGTGALPQLVDEAGKAGVFTLAFVMLPFEFEGRVRMDLADWGLQTLQEGADVVVCQPNQRVLRMADDRTQVAQAFQKANLQLAMGIHSLWLMMSRKGPIHLDFSDLQAFFESGSGNCVLGCGEGEGPKKVDQALETLRTHPLLIREGASEPAAGCLISIVGGNDLSLGDIERIVNGIGTCPWSGEHRTLGVTNDAAWDGRLLVTVLLNERVSLTGGFSETAPPPKSAAIETDPVAVKGRRSEPEAARKKKPTQPTLFSDAEAQGRFKNTDPTIIEGNNLDIPTYKRRGLLIQVARNSD